MSKKALRPVEQVVAEFVAQCEREALREIARQRAARRRRAALFGFSGYPREPRRPISGREAL